MHRVKLYSQIATSLAVLSNQRLKQVLADGKSMHEGIGGKSILISINDTPVFVKKIPLANLEQSLTHRMSTANIYDLPSSYQYGVGSAGFGAWRELATHIMTTNWTITGECINFPMMYHWRILTLDADENHINYWGDIDEYCQYWENSNAIRKRVTDLNRATSYIALFIEYVPQNLHEWLSAEIAGGGARAETAVTFVHEHLNATNQYMNERGLMHFDAHFKNILTDGKRLYLSDFGLALSSRFDLTPTETEFLKQHQSYDKACAALNLLHCIITSFWGKEHWAMRLREYLAGELSALPTVINKVIKRYAPIALLMDEFFQKLQKESKSTPYPAQELEKLFIILSNKTS